MPYELSEQKKIGLGLIGFGIFFTFLAVLLFFDRGLLALGNIFWLTGVAILLGWRSTLQLFTDRRNYKGSVSFLLGIFFIFVRWPVVGILVEIYGCILLFGGFWPSIKAFLFQIPVLGWVLHLSISYGRAASMVSQIRSFLWIGGRESRRSSIDYNYQSILNEDIIVSGDNSRKLL